MPGLAWGRRRRWTDSGSLLDAVTDLVATDNGDGTVTLDWTDPASAPDGIEVYRQVLDANDAVVSETLLDTVSSGVETFDDPFSEGGASSVTALSRDIGSVDGNVLVDITGTGFTPIPVVLFGAEAATDVTVNSATSITCRVPAHAAGMVDVSVAGVTLDDAFEYCAAQTQGFSEDFSDGTLGSNVQADLNGTGASATVTNDPGNGPTGGDYYVRCVTPVGASEARIKSALASSIVNLPLLGADGFWWGAYFRCDDATALSTQGGAGDQIKLFIARDQDDTPHLPNIGMGVDFGSPSAGMLRKKNDPSDSGLLPDGVSLGTQMGDSAGWVRIDCRYDRANSVGRLRFYVNHKLQVDQSHAAIGEDSTTSPDKKIRVHAGIAFASGHSVELTMDIGNFYYGDGYVETPA